MHNGVKSEIKIQFNRIKGWMSQWCLLELKAKINTFLEFFFKLMHIFWHLFFISPLCSTQYSFCGRLLYIFVWRRSHFFHEKKFFLNNAIREDVRNLILGYPLLTNGTFLGEIHRVNPEILGYPRIPGYPLTPSLILKELSR